MIEANLVELVKGVEEKSYKISKERQALLEDFANTISILLNKNENVKIIFICTHNSRRSHMSQIWAQTSAEYYGLENIMCFSGGTEATQFNPSAVNAVRNSGFKVLQNNDSNNPLYLVYYSNNREPIKCFSKIYNDKFNPQSDFIAVMTCSHADENCPIVFGASKRFAIQYDDPKKYDGTELEEAKYIEKFEEIGIEMVYALGKAKEMLAI